MRDFGSWLAKQGKSLDMLPDGLFDRGGKIMAICRSCEKAYEWEGEKDEFSEDCNYCGGGERCLP